MTDPKPGDAVRIIAGRHRGSKGILKAIGPVRTPAGFNVMLACVERPRAGDTYTFVSEIRLLPAEAAL